LFIFATANINQSAKNESINHRRKRLYWQHHYQTQIFTA